MMLHRTVSSTVDNNSHNVAPYVEIVEQPASSTSRFRYQCESHLASSILGASSTKQDKTFPTIRVVGFTGPALAVVSCVTKDAPYRAHPHNLVGRQGCKMGVCTMQILPETMTCIFSNIGIQCVKRSHIEQSLTVREHINVDPFLNGFSHSYRSSAIDLNAVRLCFQVFLQTDPNGGYKTALSPVVSEPIFNKKFIPTLRIVKISDDQSFVDGGHKDIVLLCEKVDKDNIQVRFFEDQNGNGSVSWEAFADVQPSQVHAKSAIWFRPPRYFRLDINEPVKVWVQLRRPSDGTTSEALPFFMLPINQDSNCVKNNRLKRKKVEERNQNTMNGLAQESQTEAQFTLNIPMDQSIIKQDPLPSPCDHRLLYSATTNNFVENGYPSLNTYATVGSHMIKALPPEDISHWRAPDFLTSTVPVPCVEQQQQSQQIAPQQNSHIPTGILIDIDEQSKPTLHDELRNAMLTENELKPININSGDLGSVNFSDSIGNLSESFNQSLSFVDSTDMKAINMVNSLL